jgi:hypothetical protein
MNEYTKYLVFKSAMEGVFGSEAWYALKESNHIPTWRKYILKALNAINISIHETVEQYDEDWLNEVEENIGRGIESAKKSKTIEELISVLAGTLLNISFLQIGFLPKRQGSPNKISLKKENWKFDIHRSVIYLQSIEQKEAMFWGKQQKKIGFDEQMKLHHEYRHSKSKLPYYKWCEEKTA